MLKFRRFLFRFRFFVFPGRFPPIENRNYRLRTRRERQKNENFSTAPNDDDLLGAVNRRRAADIDNARRQYKYAVHNERSLCPNLTC